MDDPGGFREKATYTGDWILNHSFGLFMLFVIIAFAVIIYFAVTTPPSCHIIGYENRTTHDSSGVYIEKVPVKYCP